MTLIDARTLAAEPSGIGVYTLNLLRGIHAAGPDWAVSVWVRPEVMGGLPAEVAGSGSLRLIERAGSPGSWRNQTGGARAARRDAEGGVLHVPDVFAPAWGRVRTVVTLHDVIPLVCAGELARSRKQQFLWLWRAWVKRQVRRASAVATVSAYSADDIVRELGVGREKLAVIHNAVVPRGDAGSPGRATGRFVLNVGRRDPYKNVPGLVRAFARMRAAEPALADVRLVVVGAPDPRYPEAEEAARAAGLGDAVTFQGYVAHDELAAMYAEAALVAVPSRYEGFGLPLAEAMAAGTPAVCSDRSSLPEVADGAALLVDPDDEAGFAVAMARGAEGSCAGGRSLAAGPRAGDGLRAAGIRGEAPGAVGASRGGGGRGLTWERKACQVRGPSTMRASRRANQGPVRGCSGASRRPTKPWVSAAPRSR